MIWPHQEFVEYFSSISPNFKLWNSEKNSKIMEKIIEKKKFYNYHE